MGRMYTLISIFLTMSILMVFPVRAFEPKGDVEIAVPTSAGGGSDLNARTIADIIKTEKLSPATYAVVNKPSGGGAALLAEAKTKAGATNLIITIAIGQFIGSHTLNWDIKGNEMTPIAVVADDDLFLCALTGKYKDVEEAMAATRQGRVTFGGGPKGNSDQLSFLLLNKYGNADFKYVSFPGSGDVMNALLGKHVDVGIFNPGECIGQVKAGLVVPLASFGVKRMSGDLFGKAPTFTELGYPDIQAGETRVILGPPNMPADAVQYYENLMKQVTETERWKKDYIGRNNLTGIYLNAKETKDLLDMVVEKRIPIFREAGM